MNETINIVRLRQPNKLDDTLRGILRSATRRLLAQAVEMEAKAFLAANKGRLEQFGPRNQSDGASRDALPTCRLGTFAPTRLAHGV